MADKRKIIFILGNGFDLAHGLPTKYSHFLDFCKRVERIWQYDLGSGNLNMFKENYIDGWETNELISSAIETAFRNRKVTRDKEDGYDVISDNADLTEIYHLLEDNVWYRYFTALYKDNSLRGENWIDFEFEIRSVIREIDQHATSLTDLIENVLKEARGSSGNSKLDTFKGLLKFDKYIERKKLSSDHAATVRDFREKAYEDLENLTRALELYLSVFVEKIPINNRIPEISNITPDYVINFNYTNTYQRIYGKGKVYHIHGRADAKRPAKDNNMVLGIDEYWLGNERDERTNFTIFKKFAQRIQKRTGNESYQYLKEVRKLFKSGHNIWTGGGDMSKHHPDGVSYVYVFGHSLDVTDKDILSSFIGDESTYVIVYCRDKGTEGELIANTISLISEERLLEKSNHIPTKLDYIIQQHETI